MQVISTFAGPIHQICIDSVEGEFTYIVVTTHLQIWGEIGRASAHLRKNSFDVIF